MYRAVRRFAVWILLCSNQDHDLCCFQPLHVKQLSAELSDDCAVTDKIWVPSIYYLRHDSPSVSTTNFLPLLYFNHHSPLDLLSSTVVSSSPTRSFDLISHSSTLSRIPINIFFHDTRLTNQLTLHPKFLVWGTSLELWLIWPAKKCNT